jgi:hypothetical protein
MADPGDDPEPWKGMEGIVAAPHCAGSLAWGLLVLAASEPDAITWVGSHREVKRVRVEEGRDQPARS